MPLGSPKQFVVGGQKDLRSTPFGASQVQRIEVAEPERLQLLAARDVRFLHLHPARHLREHLPGPTESLRVGHPPDLELQYTASEPSYPTARNPLQDQQDRFSLEGDRVHLSTERMVGNQSMARDTLARYRVG